MLAASCRTTRPAKWVPLQPLATRRGGRPVHHSLAGPLSLCQHLLAHRLIVLSHYRTADKLKSCPTSIAAQVSDGAGGLFTGLGGPKPPPALAAAVLGMRPGGKRSLLVPAELGYGDKGEQARRGAVAWKLLLSVHAAAAALPELG